MTVPRVDLADGYSIARIINGCWQLSRGHAADPGGDDERTIDAMLRLVDAGLTTFDCGDIYLGVESLLGAVIKRSAARAEHRPIQVHTKYVPDLEALPDIRRADVERVVDRSLRRLGVDCLDLVQLHWWDWSVRRYVDVARWLTALRDAGKVRHIGVTNVDAERLAELVEAGVPVISNQVQYSLIDRRPEHGLVDACRRHGVALIAYGVLAGGFLGPAWLDADDPRPPLANRSLVKYRLIIEEAGGWQSLQALLRETAAIAAAHHGADVANVAGRFALDQPCVAAIILGTRDARHLDSIVRTGVIELTPRERDRLRRTLPRGPRGAVYELEREAGGRHAEIMRYDLHRVQEHDA